MSEEIVTARDIDIVTAEIQVIKTEARKTLAMYSLAIGQRLCEAKSMLEHGEWMKWLSEKVEYSQSTANNLMKLYNEYGSNQQSLFENFTNSQTFQNLTTSQALSLLAVPAEERQAFAEENHVADLSTRELDKLIRERDAADQGRKNAEAQAADLQAQLTASGNKVQGLEAKAAAAIKTAESIREEVKTLEEKLQKAQAERDRIKADLAAAEKDPQPSANQMEQLRKEAEAAAKSKYAAKLDKELEKARQAQETAAWDLQKAEKEAADYKAQLVAAQASAKMQSPEVAVFKELFDGVQKDFAKMMDLMEKTRQHDRPSADNLKAATEKLLSVLLDRVKAEG